MTLDPVQIRALGALMEKEIATPETYPLSLNALLAACNQRSSRDPVMDLTEEQVRQALHTLEDMGLTAAVRDSRVPKYEHRIRTVLNLRRDETAVLCLLFLRGPQTPGELRSRADRLHSFDGLDAIQSTLDRMMRPTPGPGLSPAASSSAPGAMQPAEPPARGPLVTMLPRQPGSRESRYAHLLGTSFAPNASTTGDSAPPTSLPAPIPSNPAHSTEALSARLSALEAEVAALHTAIASLQSRLPSLPNPQTHQPTEQ